MLNELDFNLPHITKTDVIFHESNMSFSTIKQQPREDELRIGFNVGNTELADNEGFKHHLKMTRKEAFQLYQALSDYFEQQVHPALFNEVYNIPHDNSFIGAWNSPEMDEIERRLAEDE